MCIYDIYPFQKICLFFMGMGVLSGCKFVYYVCTVPSEARTGSGVTDGYKLLCGCQQVILGPLQEQTMPSTAVVVRVSIPVMKYYDQKAS